MTLPSKVSQHSYSTEGVMNMFTVRVCDNIPPDGTVSRALSSLANAHVTAAVQTSSCFYILKSGRKWVVIVQTILKPCGSEAVRGRVRLNLMVCTGRR